jgi:hypothetical protein
MLSVRSARATLIRRGLRDTATRRCIKMPLRFAPPANVEVSELEACTWAAGSLRAKLEWLPRRPECRRALRPPPPRAPALRPQAAVPRPRAPTCLPRRTPPLLDMPERRPTVARRPTTAPVAPRVPGCRPGGPGWWPSAVQPAGFAPSRSRARESPRASKPWRGSGSTSWREVMHDICRPVAMRPCGGVGRARTPALVRLGGRLDRTTAPRVWRPWRRGGPGPISGAPAEAIAQDAERWPVVGRRGSRPSRDPGATRRAWRSRDAPDGASA